MLFQPSDSLDRLKEAVVRTLVSIHSLLSLGYLMRVILAEIFDQKTPLMKLCMYVCMYVCMYICIVCVCKQKERMNF